MESPAFISLNGNKIKIQRWNIDGNVISFTTLIRGEHLGQDIVAAANLPSVQMNVDEHLQLDGQLRVLDRRTSGAGVTSALRLEMQFLIDAESMRKLELTTDQKLDAILQELKALRREVALLRGRPDPGSRGSIAPPRPGSTMLDFEIEMSDETDE